MIGEQVPTRSVSSLFSLSAEQEPAIILIFIYFFFFDRAKIIFYSFAISRKAASISLNVWYCIEKALIEAGSTYLCTWQVSE